MTVMSDISSPQTSEPVQHQAAESFLNNKWLNRAGMCLASLTVLCGLGTYLYLTGLTHLEPQPDNARLLLFANGILLTLMASLIAWQLTKLTLARMRRVPGSGLHIRMLYHRIGIDYRDECYVYDKADKANRIDRERMKLASLIVINSDDRQKAIKAVHDQCRKKGIHYPAGQSGSYRSLVDRFEEYHEPIREFFLKGNGLELQYLDSTIMASILERMTRRGIAALPVHDSVVCPARHEAFLHQVMVEEYEKVMGFKPVIG